MQLSVLTRILRLHLRFLDFNDSTAADDKDKDRSALTYSITAGNDANLFKIDGATGKVTLDTNKALDYETTPIHELTIQAADATTGTIKTDTAKLTINVKNKAADGAITFANKTGSLNEDSAIGSTVGTMAATTADGSTISKFEIKSAAGSTTTDTKSKFDIDGESGEIRLVGELDYEADTSHTITVTTTTSDGGTKDATFTLTVVDVNVAPNIVDAVVSVDEDIGSPFEIHDFSNSTAADDKDKDRSALTYSITAEMMPNLFKIDGATGKVTLDSNKALDYETTPIHELTIQAADATTGTIKTDTARVNNQCQE